MNVYICISLSKQPVTFIDRVRARSWLCPGQSIFSSQKEKEVSKTFWLNIESYIGLIFETYQCPFLSLNWFIFSIGQGVGPAKFHQNLDLIKTFCPVPIWPNNVFVINATCFYMLVHFQVPLKWKLSIYSLLPVLFLLIITWPTKLLGFEMTL